MCADAGGLNQANELSAARMAAQGSGYARGPGANDPPFEIIDQGGVGSRACDSPRVQIGDDVNPIAIFLLIVLVSPILAGLLTLVGTDAAVTRSFRDRLSPRPLR